MAIALPLMENGTKLQPGKQVFLDLLIDGLLVRGLTNSMVLLEEKQTSGLHLFTME